MKIKLLDLNLYEGGLLMSKIINFFQKENPDILILQEVYDGKASNFPKNLKTLQTLKKMFHSFYFSFSPELCDNRIEGRIELGNAVFSRFPIFSTKTVFINSSYEKSWLRSNFHEDFTNSPQNLQHLKIKLENKNLDLINIHGVWGFDGQDNPARFRMGRLIQKELKNYQYTVLAGDFNLTPDTKVVKNIEKHLVNVFKDELKSTFNIKRKRKDKGGYAKAVVDMLFVSKNIKVLSHRCPKLDISDHLPLVCEFNI